MINNFYFFYLYLNIIFNKNFKFFITSFTLRLAKFALFNISSNFFIFFYIFILIFYCYYGKFNVSEIFIKYNVQLKNDSTIYLIKFE